MTLKSDEQATPMIKDLFFIKKIPLIKEYSLERNTSDKGTPLFMEYRWLRYIVD